MKKLQVQEPSGTWLWVFCRHQPSQKLQTTNRKSQALPSKAIWAEDDLAFFQKNFPDRNFRLSESLETP